MLNLCDSFDTKLEPYLECSILKSLSIKCIDISLKLVKLKVVS